jgi:acetyl-CoA synthetase
MSQTYPILPEAAERAFVKQDEYPELYRRSVENPDQFWAEQAQRIDWINPFTEVRDVSFQREDLHIRWFADGSLNACYNCLDRHLDTRGDQDAIIWEGDDPTRDEHISYRQLHKRVSRMANVLKQKGVKRVTGSPSTCR